MCFACVLMYNVASPCPVASHLFYSPSNGPRRYPKAGRDAGRSPGTPRMIYEDRVCGKGVTCLSRCRDHEPAREHVAGRESSYRSSAERQPRALGLLRLLRLSLVKDVALGHPVLRSRAICLAVVDKGILRPGVPNVLPAKLISTRSGASQNKVLGDRLTSGCSFGCCTALGAWRYTPWLGNLPDRKSSRRRHLGRCGCNPDAW